MADEKKGSKGGQARPNPKHFDEVRSSKGKGENTHPLNSKTMGGAERLPQKVVEHVDGHSRTNVNSNVGDKHDTHANAMRAHAQQMESHRMYMQNDTGNSPKKGRGLNMYGTDKDNTEYEMTHQGMSKNDTNEVC